MKTEIERIAWLLRGTYEKGAWHGPTVKEVLQDVTAETALTRLPNTHSIIELVAHMTSWRTFVAKRLAGDTEFSVTKETNFPPTTDWAKALQELDNSQTILLEAVEKFPESRLFELVPNSNSPYQYSFYILLHGIIHHDLYHTGQIMLLKKAAAQSA